MRALAGNSLGKLMRCRKRGMRRRDSLTILLETLMFIFNHVFFTQSTQASMSFCWLLLGTRRTFFSLPKKYRTSGEKLKRVKKVMLPTTGNGTIRVRTDKVLQKKKSHCFGTTMPTTLHSVMELRKDEFL